MALDSAQPEPRPASEPAPTRELSAGSTFLWVAGIAIAYYAAGRLGLLLAIPPGYATAVWPASGIALAAALLAGPRAAPGIWLGSFLINFPTGFDPSDLVASLWPAVAIGAGAAVQAQAGAWLVRRHVGYQNLLAQELDAVRILLLGGPVACVLNAAIGPAVLWMAGRLPAEALGINAFTWWVGDSIGVLIFSTLVLAWSARPWGRWLRQQVLITAPLLLLFGLVVAAFVLTSQREEVRIQAEFRSTAGEVAGRLRDDLNQALTVLNSLEGYYASTDNVQNYQFEIFAERLLPSLRAGRGLSWNPVVASADRSAYEQRAGVRITELDANGQRVPARVRPEYVPVAVVVPRQGNEGALGFDVASEPDRREALTRARDGARPVATRPIELVQGTTIPSVLVFMPIFRSGLKARTLEARRKHTQGFVVAIFEIDELLEGALRRAHAGDLSLSLVDVTGEQAEVLHEQVLEDFSGTLQWSDRFEFAGRQWQLSVGLPRSQLAAGQGWQSWLVLTGGLMLAALAGMLLLIMTGRSVRIESLVAERTAALRDSEAELQRKAHQLAASNSELEQFAYIASHDLKAPLRSIASFAQLIELRGGGTLSKDTLDYLGFIRSGVQQMQGLVDDLLRLSRVESKRLEPRQVDMREVVDQACQLLAADIATRGARIEIGSLPRLVGDRGMLVQLFQNLIGNAIKFQKPGTTPRVSITAKASPQHWTFEVTDNGIGVEPQFLDHIFKLFKRLHSADEYPGTGIGLSICRKVVQLHGGDISAESPPGQGLTVRFSLAKELPT